MIKMNRIGRIPYDIASQQYVDDYNFDVPDGMDLMVFERGGGRLDQRCWMRRGRV